MLDLRKHRKASVIPHDIHFEAHNANDKHPYLISDDVIHSMSKHLMPPSHCLPATGVSNLFLV